MFNQDNNQEEITFDAGLFKKIFDPSNDPKMVGLCRLHHGLYYLLVPKMSAKEAQEFLWDINENYRNKFSLEKLSIPPIPLQEKEFFELFEESLAKMENDYTSKFLKKFQEQVDALLGLEVHFNTDKDSNQAEGCSNNEQRRFQP